MVQKSDEMGYRAVNIIMDKIQGKVNNYSKNLMNVDIINKDNINTYKKGDDKFEN